MGTSVGLLVRSVGRGTSTSGGRAWVGLGDGAGLPSKQQQSPGQQVSESLGHPRHLWPRDRV